MSVTTEAAPTYRDPLAILTEGRALPKGCDTWGLKTVRADLSTSNGYRWPYPGSWAEASGPFNTDDLGPCPTTVGDGLCVAWTYRGMASASVPARTLLLVAYSSRDVLGGDRDKVRVTRVRVVELLDGEAVARAYLYGADLSGADLSRADLSGAYLYGANLSRANLYGANLSRADLSRADLSGANLSGANLSRADLSGAYLYGAYLYGANLSGAIHNSTTTWPVGYAPNGGTA